MNHFSKDSYFEKSFSGLSAASEKFNNTEFERCIFEGGDFSDVEFRACQFIDCKFQQCNFSNARFPFCVFESTRFINCKLIGIDWTRLEQSLIQAEAPIHFQNSTVSQCSFYGLVWPKLVLQGCQVHNADFRSGDFSTSDFQGTDFSESVFDECRLEKCNFLEAINYAIDLKRNQLTGAKFSATEALSLLTSLDIILED